jgi:uncharacterized protein
MGAAFAAEAGSRGLSLLLVDRDAEAVEARAKALRAGRAGGTEVRTLVVDLAAPDAADRVIEAAGDELGLLVSNAAVPFVGPFLDQDLDGVLAQLDVNCRTPLVLVQRLLPRLVERGHGGIVLLSSQSAMRGTALSAGYAATKAWNMIFAESLWDEVRDLGVDVLAVLPGPTRTPGFIASAPQPGVVTANMMAPSEVAAEALDALGRVPSIVTGQQNRDSEAFMSSLDRVEAVKIMGDVMRGAYPAERSPDPSL